MSVSPSFNHLPTLSGKSTRIYFVVDDDRAISRKPCRPCSLCSTHTRSKLHPHMLYTLFCFHSREYVHSCGHKLPFPTHAFALARARFPLTAQEVHIYMFPDPSAGNPSGPVSALASF